MVVRHTLELVRLADRGAKPDGGGIGIGTLIARRRYMNAGERLTRLMHSS
jgi:hypothetical protein